MNGRKGAWHSRVSGVLSVRWQALVIQPVKTELSGQGLCKPAVVSFKLKLFAPPCVDDKVDICLCKLRN